MLKRKILENINDSSQERFSNAFGEIISVNHKENTANIKVQTKVSDKFILENIPLPTFGNGIKLQSPRNGDKVIVAFLNNNFLNARVITLIDDNYQFNTRNKLHHFTSGTYSSLIDIDNIEVKENKKCLSDYVIDENNNDLFKYIEFTRRSPINDMVLDISTTTNFDENDIGLINMDNKSIVKIKGNGCIDIFTGDNIGISINTISNSINFFGDELNSKTNNFKINADNITFKCKDFKVISENITLDSENLNMQDSKKEQSMDEIIERL